MARVVRWWLLCASISKVAYSVPVNEQQLQTLERKTLVQKFGSSLAEIDVTQLEENLVRSSVASNLGASDSSVPKPDVPSIIDTSAKSSPSEPSSTTAGSLGTQTPAKSAGAPPFTPPSHPPGNDTWYLPPKGFENTKPGTILKYRRVPKGISLDNKGAIKLKAAYQILFRTQNAVGTPEATVVTVLVPYNAKKNNVFVYHWFADSTFQDCSPSLSMQVGTREDNSFTQKQNALLVVALSQGWHVAVVDDGGPQAVFANGRHEGYAVLDSLRAIKGSNDIIGINPDPIITLYGYSGGAIAGVWATEMQAEYAPEVKIAGAAFGGLLPNTTYLFEQQALSTNRSSYGPPVMIGQAKDFKNYTDWVNDNLLPETAAKFRSVYSQCYDANWDLFTGNTTGSYFRGGDQALLSAIPASIMNTIGTAGQTGTPSTPWYIYETIGDDASPVEITDALLAKHCKNGANILYERNPRWLSHSQEMIDGIPGAMRWLIDRHEGKPIVPGCKTYETTPESQLAKKQGLVITGLIGNALAALGYQVGLDDWTAWLSVFPSRVVS